LETIVLVARSFLPGLSQKASSRLTEFMPGQTVCDLLRARMPGFLVFNRTIFSAVIPE
jgi:hypothetical protein